VKDEGKDLEFMTGLCEKMKQTSKPKQVSWNERKNPEIKSSNEGEILIRIWCADFQGALWWNQK
jgi:hypothetical protein